MLFLSERGRRLECVGPSVRVPRGSGVRGLERRHDPPGGCSHRAPDDVFSFGKNRNFYAARRRIFPGEEERDKPR